jgi:ring-1,2-phenylacetyl-CoA epoxidase subunit PaaE
LDTINLSVTGRRQESPDTATLILEPSERLPYLPGQFITLLIHHYGREVRRSFSLSSSPEDPYWSITIKRKTNGEISRHLLDHIKVGDVLKALPPSGRFTLQTDRLARRDIGFIGAGSGMVPLLPLIKQALAEEPQSHVWLLSQNHAEEDILFARQWRELEEAYQGRFTHLSLLSSPHEHHILPRRLTNANLEQILPTLLRFAPERALIYCCGPEALMRMVRFTLRLMGYQADQFRQEHFVIDTPPHAPVLGTLIEDPRPRKVTMQLKGQVYNFEVAYPHNILDAALHQHIPMPYSCRGGRCSTCMARCLSGSVLMSINDVLTDQDLASGLILTCTGYAQTDLELEM